jgi:hypothetical protein
MEGRQCPHAQSTCEIRLPNVSGTLRIWVTAKRKCDCENWPPKMSSKRTTLKGKSRPKAHRREPRTLSHGNALLCWGRSGTGAPVHECYSSSHSKTLRAAMGFSFHSAGCVKRAKECWNESSAVDGSTPAAKTKEKLAEVKRPFTSHRPDDRLLAELGHPQIQNKPLLNGTIPGRADWTCLRPQRRARRGNPDAVHCLTPSGIRD